ncbi:polyprenyl synthetase family protein [Streptomyces toxytricini]|uniref:polyprenyl synthetase family protein n=1 Tax=Streptomyces toxytricini TaxID=67369 RepID=UPI003419E44D
MTTAGKPTNAVPVLLAGREDEPGLLDETQVRHRVEAVLDAFIEAQRRSAGRRQLPTEVPHVLREFRASGGKRIRPLLCVLGWQAAGGTGDAEQVVRLAAALEMFHAFALIHDDVMDHSELRRGQPTVHRTQAIRFAPGRTLAAAEELGRHTAVLIGNLALCWSDELLHTARLTCDQSARVLPLIDEMRSEVMYGQYLDVTSTSRPTADGEGSLRIVCYKTAKYTIERPLQIGAAMAAADEPLLAALSAFALPLGEAFQLRDDLLAVFGHATDTGKPVLDDLREGKPTVLVAYALQHADPAQRRTLHSLLGDADLTESGAACLRRLFTTTGAHDAIEQMIRQRHRQALAALEKTPMPQRVRTRLRLLADQIAWRST